MDRLEQAIQDDRELAERVKVCRNPPPKDFGKDYNEFLCSHIRAVRQKQAEEQVR